MTEIYDITTYPHTDETNGDILYRSLGSFWNSIFSEKLTVKGYTQDLSEELIQSYVDLTNTVHYYSAKHTPVFDTTRWYPMVILKSQFNKAPFVFAQNDAVFGPQPATDEFFQGLTFKFGTPKSPTDNVFLYTPMDTTFTGCRVIANRMLSPSYILAEGVDFIFQKGSLFFNKNPFDSNLIPKADIIDANGNVSDTQIILWCYYSDIDSKILYNSFGYIFDLYLSNDQFYKDVLNQMMILTTESGTIDNITMALSAFLGIKPVIEVSETITDISQDLQHKIVVTDKNVYLFDLTDTFTDTVFIGNSVSAGTLLVDTFAYYDNVTNPGWWNLPQFKDLSIGFNKYIFLGNYEEQLFFKNAPVRVWKDQGILNYEIQGNAADIEEFRLQWDAKNMEFYLAQLYGPFGTTYKYINMIDFIFANMVGHNTAAIALKFTNTDRIRKFLQLLFLVSAYIPKHVYFAVFISYVLDNEVFDLFGIDGSDTGTIAPDGTWGYKKFQVTNLALGLSPITGSMDPSNRYPVEGVVANTGSAPLIKAGTVETNPGGGANSQNFPVLKLINF